MIQLLDETVPEPFAHPSRAPWKQIDGVPTCVVDADAHFVATVHTDADARLIAAAPELLLALSNLVLRYAPGRTSNDQWLKEARAAIEKAGI